MSRLLVIRPSTNCGYLVEGGDRRFCSDLCQQVPRAVRYGRRTASDGRALLHDIQDALRIKIAFIASSGYDQSGRRL